MATDRPGPADEAAGSADGPATPPDEPPRRQADEPPAEPRSRAELYADLRTADRARPTDDTHTTPDGGWSWKGLRLDPPANHVADQQLAARRVTEKFALKSPDRFKEKLAKMMGTESDRSAGDLAADIHDGIRYTYVIEFEHYSPGVNCVRQLLHGGGYEPVAFKPSWSGHEYKGVNSRWRDPASGQCFEVQFHTPDSWEAKQKTHDAYEKIESPQTSPAERARLRAYQQRISTQIPIPAGALDFRPFRERER
jgi:hypothetical protein